MIKRRSLLKAAAYAGVSGFTPLLAADAEIELSPQEAGPVISPHIYGHFIEHLGGVIYDGVWVGRNSKIPNIEGIRRQFVTDMKRIAAPNLRWPGGCFADGYHWRDGVGPAAKRPRTYNYWQRTMLKGMDATEPNQFGLHEFIHLCRLTGAEPYLAGNIGSGAPREFHDWISYCNAPSGTLTLADERAANGDKDPFRVKFWGVGNESWGCGGNMKPEEYATLYRLFVSQLPGYTQPFLIAVGPRGHSAGMDLSWTSGFFEGMRGRMPRPDGFAVHFYTDFRQTQVKAGDFNGAEWYEVFLRGIRIEEVLESHWREMAKYDPSHVTKFVVDEWGTWYSGTPEVAPSYILSQAVTLRDAMHAAMTLDIFNRHADKIAMANLAQTINCLHSLFAAHEDKYARTPAYHVFDMYRGHMGGRRVPMRIRVDDIAITALNGTAKMAGLSGSASLRDKIQTVTLTNASLDSTVAVRIRLAGGAQVAEAKGMVLTDDDMRAANTFAHPDAVVPAPLQVSVSGGVASVTVPRKAVAALELRIS